MIRRTVLAALAALALAFHPVAGQDNYREWLNVCLTGNACANFSVQLEYNPATTQTGWVTQASEGFTRITFGLANLQGLPTSPPVAPWMIQHAFVLGMSTTWTTNPTTIYHASVDPGEWSSEGEIVQYLRDYVGTPYEGYLANLEMHAAHANDSYSGQHEFWLGGPSARTGLWGCEFAPQTTGWSLRYVGCGSTLYVSILAPGEWSLTEHTQIQWSGRLAADYSVLHTCTTGVDCVTVSVPEPSSVLLLASGLLPLALVGWRRSGPRRT